MALSTLANAREKAKALLEELPGEALPQAVDFLEFLHTKSVRAQTVSEAESPWLALVQRRLSSPEQERLDALSHKLESEELSEAEQVELAALVERVEREDAERAQALLELARLRGVSLPRLMRDLKLSSLTSDE
jgi:hypothetical protein